MTEKIQELEDAVFSHHLLQDHDKINLSNTESHGPNIFKGVIEPNLSYGLDSIDVMGHRSPLYLRSLIDALSLPANIRQKQAVQMLKPTTELICEQLNIQNTDYPWISIDQKSPSKPQKVQDIEFWRSPSKGRLRDLTSQKIKIALPSGLTIKFSKEKMKDKLTSIPAINLLYQQKITTLYREQNFFNLRISELTKTINEIFKPKTPTTGLYLKLPPEIAAKLEDKNIHYFTDKDEQNWLLFPVAITNQQLHDINKVMLEVAGEI